MNTVHTGVTLPAAKCVLIFAKDDMAKITEREKKITEMLQKLKSLEKRSEDIRLDVPHGILTMEEENMLRLVSNEVAKAVHYFENNLYFSKIKTRKMPLGEGLPGSEFSAP